MKVKEDVHRYNIFYCEKNNIFINIIYKCDGYTDCPSSEDEQNCYYQLNNYFICHTGENISYTFVCDFIKDCPDGSDEENCGN